MGIVHPDVQPTMSTNWDAVAFTAFDGPIEVTGLSVAGSGERQVDETSNPKPPV